MLMLIAILCLPPTAETAVPVHSHNDYWRSRPLQEALEAGCLSIEADVVVREGKLMVGHGPREATPERTLTSMYLSPLAEIVQNGGSQGKGLATYPCQGVQLSGPAANLAIPVLDE